MNKLILLLLLITNTPLRAQDPSLNEKAVDIYNNISRSIVSGSHERILVDGAPGSEQSLKEGEVRDPNSGKYITYGGEKEGSSALITRALGPTEDSFKSYVSSLNEADREKFLRDFLGNWFKGKYRQKNVTNLKGQRVDINSKVYEEVLDEQNKIKHTLSSLKKTKWQSADLAKLENSFDIWLKIVGDKSFSFLKKQVRMNIYNGKKIAGLNSQNSMKKKKIFTSFVPNYGLSEKYFFDKGAVVTTSVGWEVRFKPQKSYGEFEEMIAWFRKTLKNVGKDFEAPGHQWIVIPKKQQYLEETGSRYGSNYSDIGKKNLKKINEVYRNIQSYIVLKGIAGRAGIEFSNYKSVHDDYTWSKERHGTGRGVIRVEDNRFKVDGANSFNIEQRAGTKSDSLRREIHKMLISRIGSGYFSDLSNADSWKLQTSVNFDAANMASKYGVSNYEVTQFQEILLNKAVIYRRGKKRKMSTNYLVALWNWDDAPFLSADKKKYLKDLTRDFIKSVVGAGSPSGDDVAEMLRQWVLASKLTDDIKHYLTPRLKMDLDKALNFAGRAQDVNVNKIHFGLEYTGRFPMKLVGEYVDIPGRAGKKEWVKTYFDYSRSERKDILREYAITLNKNLTGNTKVEVKEIKSDGHGHGLDIAFEFKDSKDRTWRVEWDGIGRSYDTEGSMISDSVRGGHIEVVTPKFTPTKKEIRAVFNAFKKNNIIPNEKMGGGHVNFDLKPFEGKPKKMASFIANYLNIRKEMSLLFQFPGRFMGGEANHVSDKLIRELHNFSGTEEELKKLLYNEKFFNTRVGRKTKNTQLNLIAYFQDVIPEEYIWEDFDMKNDYWRKSFDLQPKVRKGEFRMFNAPRNETEAALQVKFVKALYNEALNKTSFPDLDSKVNFQWSKLGDSFGSTESQFKSKLAQIGLDPEEYKSLFYEGVENFKNFRELGHFSTMNEKIVAHPQIKDWGKAVEARAQNKSIKSEGRKWKGQPIVDAIAYKDYLNKGTDYVSTRTGVEKDLLSRNHDRLGKEFSLTKKEIESIDQLNTKIHLMYLNQNKFKEFDQSMKDLAANRGEDFLGSLKTFYSRGERKGPLKWMLNYLKYVKVDTVSSNSNVKSDLTELLAKTYDKNIRDQLIKYFLTSAQQGANRDTEYIFKAAYRAGSEDLAKKILQGISADDFVFATNIEGFDDDYLVALKDSPKLNTEIFRLIKDLGVDDKKKYYTSALGSSSDSVFKIGHRFYEKNYPDQLLHMAMRSDRTSISEFRNSLFIQTIRENGKNLVGMDTDKLVNKLSELSDEKLYLLLFNLEEFGFDDAKMLNAFDEVIGDNEFEKLKELFRSAGIRGSYDNGRAESKITKKFTIKIMDRMESLGHVEEVSQYISQPDFLKKKALIGSYDGYEKYMKYWNNNIDSIKSDSSKLSSAVEDFFQVARFSYAHADKFKRKEILDRTLNNLLTHGEDVFTESSLSTSDRTLENFLLLGASSDDVKANVKTVKYLKARNDDPLSAFKKKTLDNMIAGNLRFKVDEKLTDDVKISEKRVKNLALYTKTKAQGEGIVVADIINAFTKNNLDGREKSILSKKNKEKIEKIKKMSSHEIRSLKPKDSILTLYFQNKEASTPISLKKIAAEEEKLSQIVQELVNSKNRYRSTGERTDFLVKDDFISWFNESLSELEGEKYLEAKSIYMREFASELIKDSKISQAAKDSFFKMIFSSSENLSIFLDQVDFNTILRGKFLERMSDQLINVTQIKKLKVSRHSAQTQKLSYLDWNLAILRAKYFTGEIKTAQHLALINTFPETLVYEDLIENIKFEKMKKDEAQKFVKLIKGWNSSFKQDLLRRAQHENRHLITISKIFGEELRKGTKTASKRKINDMFIDAALYNIYKKFPDSSKVFEISVYLKDSKSNSRLPEKFLRHSFSKFGSEKYMKWLSEILTEKSIISSLKLDAKGLSVLLENSLRASENKTISYELFFNVLNSKSFLFYPSEALTKYLGESVLDKNNHLEKFISYLERIKSKGKNDPRYISYIGATLNLNKENCCSTEVIKRRDQLISELDANSKATVLDMFIERVLGSERIDQASKDKSFESLLSFIETNEDSQFLKAELKSKLENSSNNMSSYLENAFTGSGNKTSVKVKDDCTIYFESRP